MLGHVVMKGKHMVNDLHFSLCECSISFVLVCYVSIQKKNFYKYSLK